MESSTYRVVKEGVSQREDGRLVERSIGEEIEVTSKAARYLLAEGYIEPLDGQAPRPRRRVKKED